MKTKWTPEDRMLLRSARIVPVENLKDYGPACGLMIVMVGAVLLWYLLYKIAEWVML